ncbi:MAG: PQQ-binding-like beta-propeller repeat protein [Bacteroidales bacterium]|nr:PQQ-binding-like beta-propeller repeat protein [Bacteroidales bacterium]
MKKYTAILVLSIYLCISGCSKTSTGPEEKTDPIGYQKDIDWPTLADSPWPMFQNNPQSTGRSRYQGPQKGIIAKKITLDSGSDLSFITIGKNNNYYLAIGNFCADSTGEADAYLFSYNSQGLPNWYVNIEGNELFSSPLIDQDGIIYIGSKDGVFYAINPDGSVKWKYDAASPIFTGYGGPNIGLDGTIYFGTRDALFAINQEGQLLWSKSEYQHTRVVFSCDGNTMYVQHNSEGLDALDLNGNLIWRFHFSTERWMFHPIVDSNDRVYLFADRSTIYALDKNGRLEWEFSIDQYRQRDVDTIDQTIAPTLDNIGNFYFTTTDDLYSIDYFGKLRWIIHGMGSAGSHLICDNDNNVFLTKLNRGNVLSISNTGVLNWILTLNCSEMITCSPAISSDSQFIIITNYNSKSLLYLIE